MTLVGRLSVVGAAPPPPGTPLEGILRQAAVERTLPVVCRNAGIPCALESGILSRQVRAAHQVREILRRVEVLPLKGVYLGHRVYPSPALRDLGDVDLLVRRSDLASADAELRRLGYDPVHDACMLAEGRGDLLNAVLYHREDSLPVHLHWGLSNASLPHFMYRIDADEVWRESRGGGMWGPHLLLTLCEHALKHSFRALIHLTDVEIVSRTVDWGAVADTARRWGLERPVHYALALLRDLMGVDSPGLERLGARPLGWAGRMFLQAARRRRWDGLSALGLLSMAPGPGGKARFLKETLIPRTSALEGLRTRSPWGRLGRAVSLAWQGMTGLGAG
jgi:hypothetical protein